MVIWKLEKNNDSLINMSEAAIINPPKIFNQQKKADEKFSLTFSSRPGGRQLQGYAKPLPKNETQIFGFSFSC